MSRRLVQPLGASPTPWLTPSLITKVAVVGLVVWGMFHLPDLLAWSSRKTAPLTSKVSNMPVVGPMVDPKGNQDRALQGVARAQLASYARALAYYKQVHGAYPLDFSGFLKEHTVSAAEKYDPTLDPWQTPYRYLLLGSGYELRSAGPDRLWMTGDDVVVSKED